MYVRTAFFVGQPAAGSADQFRAGLETATAQYAKLPGVRSAHLELPLFRDDNAPDIYATIRMVFDAEHDIERALSSPERQLVRAAFAGTFLRLFEGTVAHVNSVGFDFE